ncbi:accessory gland protein Acp29AB-like [Drosophila kikkawai]|uniref:Accessory gland protein Acp29AB-like n=1 Tax=Drosophila kikkawai TaxID=30033 RepID=A0A6P4I9V2_DROKI|nr:accessory gland protein Acp29AB-like [Drosophila kikkawai]
MRYFLVVLFSALCHTILARGLQDNPVFYDLERRLVRLEDRQFSESQNLEHRMLEMEVQLGTQQEDDKYTPLKLEPNFYEVDGAKVIRLPPSENMKLIERLEKLEKNWEKDLEEKISKFTSKYDNLAERFSVVEDQVKGNLNAELEEKIRIPGSNYKWIGSKHYYIEHENQLTWFAALSKCGMLNGKLASLQNEEEWSAITDHLEADKSYWIDINDILEEGEYVSGLSSQIAPFLKWEAREPNNLILENSSEDCVELRRDYNHYMNDIVCSERNYYICELNI